MTKLVGSLHSQTCPRTLSRDTRKPVSWSTVDNAKFRVVFEAIRELMTPPEPKKRPIGFVTPTEK